MGEETRNRTSLVITSEPEKELPAVVLLPDYEHPYPVGVCPKCELESPFAYSTTTIVFLYCLRCHNVATPEHFTGFASHESLENNGWDVEL